jgi:hypothetical protein
MAMLYFIANASDCTHQTGLVHSGGSRVDVGPGEWLYAMFIPHVGHAKHYLKEQCKAAGITVEVFPLLKSKNPVSAAALATLTAYLGTAPADGTSATIIADVFAFTGDPWFDPDGAD